MQGLSGKAAVITGATSGIGLALAREGAALMLADLDAGAPDAAVAGPARSLLT